MTELHDDPRFPEHLRDLVTDALEALWEFGNSYGPVLPMLYEGLAGSEGEDGRFEVVDLCSGGGGPWVRLTREFERAHGVGLHVCLTDKYPNVAAFERTKAAGRGRVEYVATPVDATQVPRELRGFRTVFSSFHHFGPEAARAMLRDAAESGEGTGIFEVARRDVWTMVVLCFTPLLVLWLTLWMRPFRWSRLLWTFVVPVVPFTIWFDGWVSCLRAYGEDELREMVTDEAGYRWEIGEVRSGLLPVTYVVGRPVLRGAKKGAGIGMVGQSATANTSMSEHPAYLHLAMKPDTGLPATANFP